MFENNYFILSYIIYVYIYGNICWARALVSPKKPNHPSVYILWDTFIDIDVWHKYINVDMDGDVLYVAYILARVCVRERTRVCCVIVSVRVSMCLTEK